MHSLSSAPPQFPPAEDDEQAARIQQLEEELDEMTAALAQAWDQLVPFLQETPEAARTTTDIVPLVESIMAAVDAPMGAIYFAPQEGRQEEWFALPSNVVGLSALQKFLDDLVGQAQPVHATNIMAWNAHPTQWMFTPMVLSGEVVGAIGVGFDGSGREFTAVDARLIKRMTERAVGQMAATTLMESQAREAKITHELQIAGLIQRSIQPPAAPVMPGLDIGVKWQPAFQVGGDAWGWVRLAEDELGLFMVDVAGKGLPAALAAVSLHTAMKMVLRLNLSPAEVLQQINEEFYDIYTNAGLLATAVIARIHPASGRVLIANVGHTPTLLRLNGRWQRQLATTPPIGVLPTLVPREIEMTLGQGDLLILFSDGVTEIDVNGRLWGDGGIISAVPDEEASPSAVVQHVSEAADAVRQANEPHDDFTLLCVGLSV